MTEKQTKDMLIAWRNEADQLKEDNKRLRREVEDLQEYIANVRKQILEQVPRIGGDSNLLAVLIHRLLSEYRAAKESLERA